MWFPPQYDHPATGSVPRPEKEPEMLRIIPGNEKGIAHLQLNRPPVNSLNLVLLTELKVWLRYLGSDSAVKALVISSASPGIFSAGLDFKELSHPTREQFTEFWETLQEMWLILNTFPKPVVAAVNGNSPAGGCAIAMSCDYRVMARQRAEGRPYIIGLNESQLGIVAPPWAAANYVYLVGQRTAEQLLVKGELIPAENAHKIGLVDLVTDDEASSVAAAFEHAERLLAVSTYALTTSRAIARRGYLNELAGEGNRANDTRAMADLVLSDDVQKILDAYMASLKAKSKK